MLYLLVGLTRTDGLVMPPEMVDQGLAQTSLGRLGVPEDVADIVAFLASNDGRRMTGQLIRAGGGLIQLGCDQTGDVDGRGGEILRATGRHQQVRDGRPSVLSRSR